MPNATIAVRGSASADFPADFASLHFQQQFTVTARSDALAHGNVIVAQLREMAAQNKSGIRDMKVHSLRVEEAFNYVGPDNRREPAGWSGHVTGEALAETINVPEVAAEVTRVGVSISHITWHLEDETEAKARRVVRRIAVADAVEAANDFAAALSGTVGELITLADPGLLSAGVAAGGSYRPSRAGNFFAAATSSALPWDERVDIDPSVITISANVEASYEVNFTKG